ncbi:pilus assembly protein [Mesorhizobium sp. LHD-90]|uniref:pilus assembly protein n=1 Tax=Mesorhizobium sp. LHD-90 TaxID=3071414 RepID=UPI0027E0BAD8|nr:pilus assembly protein [Mesorhizobium sp. LHD-90]MDQ6435754.1 pilus assembly protein [Mesorhizobium sp. LHD-90]
MLLSDRRGIAAVEFALLAPLMLAAYFVTLEVSSGIDGNRKVSRTASMVADLITQQDTMTKADLKAIMEIGEAIMQPYNRSKPVITATAIEITPQPNSQVRVAWSGKLDDSTYSKPFAAGSAVTVPAALNIPGSFLIRVETELSYKPMITWAADQKEVLGLAAAFDGIEMSETYHLRPRMSQSIPCSDC